MKLADYDKTPATQATFSYVLEGVVVCSDIVKLQLLAGSSCMFNTEGCWQLNRKIWQHIHFICSKQRERPAIKATKILMWM